jgi:hypothetical protein
MASLVSLLITFKAVNAVRTSLHVNSDDSDDFLCEIGQGEAGKTYFQIGGDSKKSCASLCNSDIECHGFDFREEYSSHVELHTGRLWVDDSCRLYGQNKPRIPEIGSLTVELATHYLTGDSWVQKQANGREYCRKRSLLPSASDTDSTTNDHRSLQEKFGFPCKHGQGEALKSYDETGDQTFEDCATLCDADVRCQGFDFKEQHSSHYVLWGDGKKGWVEDSCRLYKKNFPRITDMSNATAREAFGGSAGKALALAGTYDVKANGRKYCSKV